MPTIKRLRQEEKNVTLLILTRFFSILLLNINNNKNSNNAEVSLMKVITTKFFFLPSLPPIAVKPSTPSKPQTALDWFKTFLNMSNLYVKSHNKLCNTQNSSIPPKKPSTTH